MLPIPMDPTRRCQSCSSHPVILLPLAIWLRMEHGILPEIHWVPSSRKHPRLLPSEMTRLAKRHKIDFSPIGSLKTMATNRSSDAKHGSLPSKIGDDENLILNHDPNNYR